MTEQQPTTARRRDKTAWLDADPLMTQAEAEWYALVAAYSRPPDDEPETDAPATHRRRTGDPTPDDVERN